MQTTPTLQDWNVQSLAVVQAMLGILSPNFRRVSLGHNDGVWLITFVLEREDIEDHEEIEDFCTEWDALQTGPEPREVRTVVTSQALPWPLSPTRILYLRREAASHRGLLSEMKPY
jgi:hypothetical protein